MRAHGNLEQIQIDYLQLTESEIMMITTQALCTKHKHKIESRIITDESKCVSLYLKSSSFSLISENIANSVAK